MFFVIFNCVGRQGMKGVVDPLRLSIARLLFCFVPISGFVVMVKAGYTPMASTQVTPGLNLHFLPLTLFLFLAAFLGAFLASFSIICFCRFKYGPVGVLQRFNRFPVNTELVVSFLAPAFDELVP